MDLVASNLIATYANGLCRAGAIASVMPMPRCIFCRKSLLCALIEYPCSAGRPGQPPRFGPFDRRRQRTTGRLTSVRRSHFILGVDGSRMAWSARVPTLILIGEADHWSSASACQQMVAGAHGRSALATIMVYPGAGHNFDRSNFPSRQRGTQKWTSGAIRKSSDANVAARTDALKLIREWFER